MNISVCTFCKGRLHHAIQNIPHTLSLLGENDELILVDYDCPDKVGEWCEQNHKNVKVVFVKNRVYWNASHAHNCAGVNAKNDIILFLDIDVVLNEKLIEEVRNMKEGNFLRHNKVINMKDGNGNVSVTKDLTTYGTCAVYNKDFKEVNGYEEAFVSWGHEDESFYKSLRALGMTDNYFINYGHCITHDDTERNRYLGEGKWRWHRSNARICKILRKRHKYKNNINRNWGVM